MKRSIEILKNLGENLIIGAFAVMSIYAVLIGIQMLARALGE